MDGLFHVYRLVLLLCAIGLTISSLEYWTIAGCFGPGGLYSWNILRLRFGLPLLSRLETFGGTAVRALLAVRCIALLLLLLLSFRSLWFSADLLLLIGCNLVLSWRMGIGEEGSDRMNAIVLFAVLLCAGPQSTPFILRAGLWFIALQSCLSYATSGFAKLASPSWRQGEAVLRILSTETYGLDALALLVEGRKWLQRSLCWGVILIEALFPLALILPAPWSWVLLAGGLCFHLFCAIVMGFNAFLWAFVATYPAILYASATFSASFPAWRFVSELLGR